MNRASGERLLATYGPFAATERLMMELVRRGADRQALHEIIREHAMTAWAEVQAGRPNPLIDLLGADPRLAAHASQDQIFAWLDASDYVGDARGTSVRNGGPGSCHMRLSCAAEAHRQPRQQRSRLGSGASRTTVEQTR